MRWYLIFVLILYCINMTERDKFEGAEGAEDYEFAAGELDDICREGLPPISDWMKKEL